MKYLNSFKKYKQERINEEEGILSTAALAASLLFNNVNSNPQQVGVQTEIVSENPKLEVNYLEASTSDSKCFNNALYKFGLTKTPSKFYTCSVGEFKARIGGDTTQILADFKPTKYDAAAADFLKIGNDQLSDSGTESFDLSNDNDIIVASANGLLALTRISRAAKDTIDYSVIRVTFKSERGSKSVHYDLGDKLDRIGNCNTAFFMFQTAITPKEKFHPQSIGAVTLPKLIGASEDFQVEYMTSFFNNIIRGFIPKEIQEEVLQNVKFTKFDSNLVRDFLKECKKTGTVDFKSFNLRIIPVYKKFYLDNFKLFVDSYFPEKIAQQIYSDYSRELNFKSGNIFTNVWEKSHFEPTASVKPSYKAPEIKYSEGN